MTLKYRRVLLKFSGEALMGSNDFGLDSATLEKVVAEIRSAKELGAELALVVGGGNLFRGVQIAGTQIQRTTGDQMGMMATVMNALALRDVIEAAEMTATIMAAMPIESVAVGFNANEAKKRLVAGEIVIFAAGTGNPFFTTDTAAALRGIEVQADIVLKATKVDGIYTADPIKDPQATRYQQLSYDEVIEKQLQVMDLTAFVLCRDHKMPIRVFDMFKQDAVKRILQGEDEGTLVTEEK